MKRRVPVPGALKSRFRFGRASHEALAGILLPATDYNVKANRTASYLLMFLSEMAKKRGE